MINERKERKIQKLNFNHIMIRMIKKKIRTLIKRRKRNQRRIKKDFSIHHRSKMLKLKYLIRKKLKRRKMKKSMRKM